MVNSSEEQLNLIFSALSDPTRRSMLSGLSRGPMTVSEVAGPLPMSLPAVSKHVKILEGSGLLTRHRVGREHRLEFNPAPLLDAVDWIEHQRAFWGRQFDALEEFLKATDPEDNHAG